MSTYTDLHNKIKENLTVGYSPDDRITTQKVRFYNNGNEYWGTFKGTFNAEQVDLNGGVLRDVKIIGATLSNVSWPGGVDFDAFGALMRNVSAEVDSINDEKIPFVHSRITDEISARIKADDYLEKMIFGTDTRLSNFADSISRDLRRELSALKKDITDQERYLSTDIIHRSRELSTTLDDKIDDVSAYFDEELHNVSSDLSAQDKALSVEIHTKVDNNYVEMLANDTYLSSELSTTQLNLIDEIGTRARADESLKADINSISSISDARDGILQDHIDQLNADASLSIDVLRDETNYNIEIERHYEYKVKANGLTNIKSYPFQLDDYAVNSFEFRDVDGQVYLESDTGVYVALVKKEHPESLFPLTLFPYKNNKADYRFNSAFDASKQSYKFESPDSSVSLGNGFNMMIVAPAQEEQKSELSNYIFRIEPQAENCHNVCTQDGETNLGNVTAAFPTGSTGNVISGLLTINAPSDPTYNQFSHFIKIPFNTTDLSAPEPDAYSTGYIYHGGNKLDLVKYHPLRYFARLSDDIVGHDNETFGTLYQTVGGNPAIISDDLGNIKSITVFLDDYNAGQPIILNEANYFEEILDDNYATEDGDIAIVSLKAQVDNDAQTAVFAIGQKSTLYSYNFYGKDVEGDDVIAVGQITPRVFNRKINQFDVDYTELTADVSHVITFQSMNTKIAEIGGLVLKKSLVEGESDVWFATVVDDYKNVLDAKYIGHTKELRLKLTLKNTEDSEIGQIIAQKYVVDLDTTTPVDGNVKQFVLHKTQAVDLGLFDQSTRKVDKYPILIDSAIVDNTQNTWDLTITTSENDIFKAIVPPQIVDENGKIVLREFVIDATIESLYSDDTTFRKFKLFDDHGCPITLVNTTQIDATSIYVNPNRRAIYAIKEVAPNQFAVLDFNDEEDNHWIEMLTQKTNNLSTEIQLLSAALSVDILDLSSNLSSDIDSLSTRLSTDIVTLSSSLCTDINYLSDNISADVFALSSNLCADIVTLSTSLSIDIDALSVELSTDISCLSTSLCSDIKLSAENLQNQILSNDDDITYLSSTLSTLSINISTDVSCLSANISSDVSSLSAHYFKTLSTDIQFDVVYHHDGSHDTLSRPVYTDQLLIIDEVTMDRYRLTIRNGALNINKVDNQARFE